VGEVGHRDQLEAPAENAEDLVLLEVGMFEYFEIAHRRPGLA